MSLSESDLEYIKRVGYAQERGMAVDFSCTKRNATFEQWHEQLQDYAELRGGSASDADAWQEDYEAGKTPIDAYCDEWGDD